ncbi:hypothetical protein HXX76_006034 [Chlamydomonas incerta]|uniref:Uncharacterized protein n=1 Tax=Chlamydomonas incerta TaxID=51695 RepID=A0A835W1S0_CHLIN|nr:hypothetical protein HXX76_006034 [Chlamydomonas incerta]|eukprot:KAG2437382.1 hypothetical protein HXX76_006034 [Chlamydomonas incerta]
MPGLPAAAQRPLVPPTARSPTAGSTWTDLPGDAEAAQVARLHAGLPLSPPGTAVPQPLAGYGPSGASNGAADAAAGREPGYRAGAHIGVDGCGAAVSPGLPHSGSDRSVDPSVSGSGSGRSFCRYEARGRADATEAMLPPRRGSGTGSDGRTADHIDVGRGSGSGCGSGSGGRSGSGSGSASGNASAAAASQLPPAQQPGPQHPLASVTTIGTAATNSCGPAGTAPLAALHSSGLPGPNSAVAPRAASASAGRGGGGGGGLGSPGTAHGAAAAGEAGARPHPDVDEQLNAVPATTAGSVLDMMSTQLGPTLHEVVKERLKKRIRIIQPISQAWVEETLRTPSGPGGGGGAGDGDHAWPGDAGGRNGAAAGRAADAAAAAPATSTECGICRQDSSASGRTVQGKAPALTPLRARGTARPASSAAGLEGRGGVPVTGAAGTTAAALVQCHRACSQDASRLAVDLQTTVSGRAAGAMADVGAGPAAGDARSSGTPSLDLLAAAAAAASAGRQHEQAGAAAKQESLTLLATGPVPGPTAPVLAHIDMSECSPFGVSSALAKLVGSPRADAAAAAQLLAHPGGARAGDVGGMLGRSSSHAAAAACMPPPRQQSAGAAQASKAAAAPAEAAGKGAQATETLGFASVFLPPHASNSIRTGSIDNLKHSDKPSCPTAADGGVPPAAVQQRPHQPAIAAARPPNRGRAQAAVAGHANTAAAGGAVQGTSHLPGGAPAAVGAAGMGGSRACGDASMTIGGGATRGAASSGALPTGPGSVSAATAVGTLPSVCPPSAAPASTGAAAAWPMALGPGDPLRLLQHRPPACLGKVQGELTLLYQWYVANKTVYLDQARQQLQRVESLTAQAVSNAAAVAAAAATSGGPHAAGDAAIALSSAAMARAESSEAIRAFETALQIMRVCSKVEQQSVAAGGGMSQPQMPHPLLHPQAAPLQPPPAPPPLGVPLAAWQADVAAAAAAAAGMPQLHLRQPVIGYDSRESADLAMALAASKQQAAGGAEATAVPPGPWLPMAPTMAPGPEAALAVAAALVGAAGMGGSGKERKARRAGRVEAAPMLQPQPQPRLLDPPGGLGPPPPPPLPRGLPPKLDRTCAAAADVLGPATTVATAAGVAPLMGSPAAAPVAPPLAPPPNTGRPALTQAGGRAKA